MRAAAPSPATLRNGENGPCYGAWAGNHGQVIFQTHPVREPPHRPGRADKIPELVGAIQRSGVVVDVVMNMLAVSVGGDEKGILALCPAHRRFVAHPVCLLWGDLARLE